MKPRLSEDLMTENNRTNETATHLRMRDPYLDRRGGEDRRERYSLYYFDSGGIERRVAKERRINFERRKGYARVSTWASACLVPPVSPEA